MAGENIAILRLLRLKNALLATISSKEFIHLHVFDSVCQVLMNPDFWKWAFVMCRSLYAPMPVLCLDDQKSPSMDKLNYYVLQTDQMLALYCKDEEEHGVCLLTAPTIRAVDCLSSAGLSDDLRSEHEDNGVDSMNNNDDGDNSISAHLDTQNSNDDAISDGDNKQQVFM
jgi:hypothetical protein